MRIAALLTAIGLVLSQIPEQIHISLGELPRSLTVQWVTFSPTPSSTVLLCSPACTTVTGSMRLWVYTHKSVPPLPRYLHSVSLLNLTPYAVYNYQVGSEQAYSPVFSFRGPAQDSQTRSFNHTSFLVFGDFGVCSDRSRHTLQALVREAEEMRDEAFVHTGDMAYNLEYESGKRGDEYMRAVQPFASKVPYMVVVGNHEKHQNFTHFKHRFSMPQAENDNLFYSVNLGPVHLIMYSSEVFCSKQHCKDVRVSQWNWLIQDLENARGNRRERPWIVAFAHKPLYCSTEWRDTSNVEDCFIQPLDMRKEYEDLLAAYNVDIHFHGHVHAYERTAPLYQGHELGAVYSSPHLYVQPKAPIYVVEGSAGTCRPDDVNYPSITPESWSVFRSADFGYSRVEANITTLKVTRYKSEGGVEDFFCIIKPYNKSIS